MRILITGAAGTCGSDMAPILEQHYGYDVITSDIRKPDNDLPFVYCDISSPEDVERAVKGKDIDVIIHLATLQPEQGPPSMSVDVNVKGTCNILDSASRHGVKRVIFTSSVWAASRGPTAAYKPIDEHIPCVHEGMYGITKRMGEQLCEYYSTNHGMSTIAFRFCGYWPTEGFSDAGDILWDEVDVRTLAWKYLAVESRPTGSAGKLPNAWDLTQAFRAAIENTDIQHDLFIIGVGAPFGREDAEGLKEAPLVVMEKYYPGVSAFCEEIGLSVPPILFWYDTSKATEHLGFSPRCSFQDIMQQYYAQKAAR